MDFDMIKSRVANLTLYDLKAGVRQVQNAVMNLTEMESKVREATNADPWGAPSSLMQEIASGTHNYQQLNEIMPLIYKRFTDKTAEEWRQIYKALQLLEFLVKNGSERVIDDARSHLSLIKMLRQFAYIDQNGKDQGLNVRNRANELGKLLSDVDQIRAERKKARANKNKYGGVEGGAGLGSGFSSGGGNRYGGFGSETGGFGAGYSGEVYGDGGGFGGQDPELRFGSTQRHDDDFEEYDAGGDDNGSATTQPTRKTAQASTTSNSSATRASKAYTPAPKKAEPQPDLFDFGEEENVPVTAALSAPKTMNGSNSKTPAPSNDFGADDDFDDFQEAASPAAQQPTMNPISSISPPISTTTSSIAPSSSHTNISPQIQAPKATGPNYNLNMNALLSAAPAPKPQIAATSGTTPIGQNPSQAFAQPKTAAPNYYTSVRADSSTSGLSAFSSSNASQTRSTPTPSATSMANLGKPTSTGLPKATSSSGGDAFGSIWSSASSKAGIQQKPTQGKGMGMAAMQKEKSSQGIWGAASTSSMAGSGASTPSMLAAQPSQKQTQPIGNGLDDLLG